MSDVIEFWVDGKPNENKNHGTWYLAVACKAQEMAALNKGFLDPRASYWMEITFRFIRPKSVKDGEHIVKPDLTRLEISTLKAMEHILFPDVKQIVRICKNKTYLGPEGALIKVVKDDRWRVV